MNVNELLSQLTPIGLDPASGGYRRFSWTTVDLALRRWFVDQARTRKLRIHKDRNANLWAFLPAPKSDRPEINRPEINLPEIGEVVAVGSHLDSVPDGGAFDGPLGIVSAFAALDILESRGLRPGRPVAVVAFTEEEGARFGMPCLGSRLLTGAVEPDRARSLTDPDGVTLEQAMLEADEDPSQLGPDPSLLAGLRAYVELHIEQGAGLSHLGHPVAVGAEIWPHGRWRLEFPGTANHAGTTPMQDRNDPIADFATTVLRVMDAARSQDSRATFGRVRVVPNSTNAIPSLVTAWLDARAATTGALEMLVESIGDEVKRTEESLTPAVEFDRDLRDRLVDLLGGVPVLPTAAGHDAGVLSAAGVPTAMLFVRNPTGVSHSPSEHATPDDCIYGAESLARVLTFLGDFQ